MTVERLTTVTCDGCGKSHSFTGVVASMAVEQTTVLRKEGWRYDTHGNHWCGECIEARDHPQGSLL